VLEGLDSALNRKPQVRLSRQKILDGAKEAKVIALCCGAKPSGHARWTLRLLAERVVELDIVESISHETVASTTNTSGMYELGGVLLGSEVNRPSLSSYPWNAAPRAGTLPVSDKLSPKTIIMHGNVWEWCRDTSR
jgi:hypothetical protein